MLWVYQEFFKRDGYWEEWAIEAVLEDYNDPGFLAETFSHAIYFYADLTPLED